MLSRPGAAPNRAIFRHMVAKHIRSKRTLSASRDHLGTAASEDLSFILPEISEHLLQMRDQFFPHFYTNAPHTHTPGAHPSSSAFASSVPAHPTHNDHDSAGAPGIGTGGTLSAETPSDDNEDLAVNHGSAGDADFGMEYDPPPCISPLSRSPPQQQFMMASTKQRRTSASPPLYMDLLSQSKYKSCAVHCASPFTSPSSEGGPVPRVPLISELGNCVFYLPSWAADRVESNGEVCNYIFICSLLLWTY